MTDQNNPPSSHGLPHEAAEAMSETKLTVTVVHPKRVPPQGLTLRDLADHIDAGEFAGAVTESITRDLDPDQVEYATTSLTPGLPVSAKFGED